MGNYICMQCKFRFNSKNPSDCPYCGRKTLEREKDASELIDEVNKMLRE